MNMSKVSPPTDSISAPDPPPYSGINPSGSEPPDTITVEQAAERNPPPSYESLFGKIKRAKRESRGKADFCRRVNQIWLKSLMFKVLCGLYILLSIACIVIGAIYMYDCPAERMIPIFLVVDGVFLLVFALVNFLMSYKSKVNNGTQAAEAAADKRKKELGFIFQVLLVFLFIWFISGNIWVHGTQWTSSKTTPNITTTTNTTVTKYCDPVVYYYTFSFVLLPLCIIGCIILYVFFSPVIRHLYEIIKENTCKRQ